MIVLGINAWNEPKGDVVRFARGKRLRYDFLLDGADVFRAYGLRSVPTVLYLDQNGIVVDAELGFSSPEPLLAKADALMKPHAASHTPDAE